MTWRGRTWEIVISAASWVIAIAALGGVIAFVAFNAIRPRRSKDRR